MSWREGVGVGGEPKATIQTQTAVLCLQYVILTDIIHRGWAKTAIKRSLAPYAVPLMPLRSEKRILAAQ